MQNDFQYIKVALPIASAALFTYKIVFPHNCKTLIGSRVLVSFRNRLLTGIIVEFDEDPPKNCTIKNIHELIDDTPVFSENILKLAKWIAEYYMCSLGETLKAALPQGMNTKSVIKAKIADNISSIDINQYFKNAPKRKELFQLLQSKNNQISIDYLQKQLKISAIAPMLAILEKDGLIEQEQTQSKQVKPLTFKAIRLNNQIFDDEAKLNELFEQFAQKAPKRSELLLHLCEVYSDGTREVPIRELKGKASQSVINYFEKAGIVDISQIEVNRSFANQEVVSLAKRNEFLLEMTEEQQYAANHIISSIDSRTFKPYLLHGITGSGKTLVYIHAINHTLEQGRKSLLLVPEISLTPQLIDRFNKVFPEKIAVFHSKMSEGERYDAWRSAQSGKAEIVIGARSAVFAPFDNLGLIIVDEEHEPSYKQDSPNPRYNGRDTAVMRAFYENATVVLGSATPSFESLYNSSQGRYELLKITQRADGARLPDIKVIDTISAGKSGQMKGTFSKELIDKIIDRISKKEGVILFQNRRGFSSYLECPDCAEIPVCKHCSVTLVYHKTSNILSCHYCGYTQKAHQACYRCGYPKMNEIGSGTQRIEDELSEYLDILSIDYTIERMDLDTTGLKGSHRAMLERFATGKTDILVGTQMVAKGIDFDRVTLVGVVNADIQLFLPDFRAGERTIQLLLQVAGRAGRSAEKAGEVLIQTAHPNDLALLKTLEADYVGYYENEVDFRKNALYPPYSRFVMIEFADEDTKKVENASKFFESSIPRYQQFIVLGPIVPTIAKIRSKHRRLIIIKNIKEYDSKGVYLRHALRQAEKVYNDNGFSSVKYSIDIDTLSGL